MLEIIGEATKHIPEAVRKEHPFVLWRKMIVIREVIIHAYFGVNLKHNGRTRFHVSISFMQVIQNFEQSPAGFDESIEAASKLAAAGYTIGFIVAQIMIYDRWKRNILNCLESSGKGLIWANRLNPSPSSSSSTVLPPSQKSSYWSVYPTPA